MKMILAVLGCSIACITNATAQQSSSDPKGQKRGTPVTCPMHHAHAQLNERGEKGMGFSQSATTHHFFLKADAGIIQVEANNSADATSRDEIRIHLRHIARAFQIGDFDTPMFVHDTLPSGVPEMKRFQKQIRYTFEESTSGGRVVISSADKDAVEAIHNFLRFQIEEHRTGDATDVR